MKKCPFCAEDIQDAAVKCRYCGSMLEDTRGGRLDSPPSASTFRSLLFWLVLVVLGVAIWQLAGR